MENGLKTLLKVGVYSEMIRTDSIKKKHGRCQMKDNLMKDKLKLALFEAEAAGDTPFLQTLRLIATVLEDRHPAVQDVEEDANGIIRQVLSYHQERLSIFQESGAHKKAQQETVMIQKLESLLPKGYSEEALYDAIHEKITACGARSIRDLKTVMTLLRQDGNSSTDYEQAKAMVIRLLT